MRPVHVGDVLTIAPGAGTDAAAAGAKPIEFVVSRIVVDAAAAAEASGRKKSKKKGKKGKKAKKGSASDDEEAAEADEPAAAAAEAMEDAATCIMMASTEIEVAETPLDRDELGEEGSGAITYDDLGGIAKQIEILKEVVETRLVFLVSLLRTFLRG